MILVRHVGDAADVRVEVLLVGEQEITLRGTLGRKVAFDMPLELVSDLLRSGRWTIAKLTSKEDR